MGRSPPTNPYRALGLGGPIGAPRGPIGAPRGALFRQLSESVLSVCRFAGWACPGAPGPSPGPLGPLATARAPAVITRSVPGLGGLLSRRGGRAVFRPLPIGPTRPLCILPCYILCPGCIAVCCNLHYEVILCVRVVLPLASTQITRLHIVSGLCCRSLQPTSRS